MLLHELSTLLRSWQLRAFAAAIILPGCGKKEPNLPVVVDSTAGLPPLSQRMLALPTAPQTETVFAQVSGSISGLQFEHALDLSHPLKRLYSGGFAVGGVAIGDLDGDDRPDIFVVHGPGTNVLYRQTDQALKFEDYTKQAKVDGGGAWGTGAAFADIDNDNDLDIYVCNYDSPNQLFINDGKAHFQECAADYGLDLINASLMPSFCDYDRDGDLDLYVLTNRFYLEGGVPAEPFFMSEDGVKIKANFAQWYDVRDQFVHTVGQRDVLYRNEGVNELGDPIFKNVSGYSGDIAVKPGHGLAATWWDYDEDGFPDLYVSNDEEDRDRLYHNQQDGTFTEVGAKVLPYTPWHSRGATVADLDSDGRLDLFCVDDAGATPSEAKRLHASAKANTAILLGQRPPQHAQYVLYLNGGGKRVREVARLANLPGAQGSWAPLIADFDHDGRSDIIITTGAARPFADADLQTNLGIHFQHNKTLWDFFEEQSPLNIPNRAFTSRDYLQFEDVSRAWGVDQFGMSYGGAYGDLDGDGDLDVVVANLDAPLQLYRNDSEAGARLLIRLIGKQSNRWGIGARVTVRHDDGEYVRTLQPQSGFLGSHDPLVHIAVKDAVAVDQLEVLWPSGILQTLDRVKVNQRLTIVEPSDQKPTEIETKVQPLFETDDSLQAIKHEETFYPDFETQSLLSRKISTLGPGLALGDMNDDGTDDLFLGGSTGLSGQFFQRKSRGTRPALTEPFLADSAAEDQMPLFLDANSDGHLDIYVVSGGVETSPGKDALTDRIYLGNSRGGFVKVEGVLPNLRDSGYVIAAADFDQDEDLDLFIGGRSQPGKFPNAAPNRLLTNQLEPGKPWRFIDSTNAIAPGLKNSGIVTSAVCSDVNNDGWVDLVVAHDWGALSWYRNTRGKLTKATNTGLESWIGRWSSIIPGDVDNDGDIDYAAMNVGLNTVYGNQPTRGVQGFANEAGVIEAVPEGRSWIPLPGRARITRAIPSLANRFKTHAAYGSSSIDKILADTKPWRQLKTLQSGVFLNDGAGKFTFKPLPREAHLAPTTGAALMDFDGDFKLDLVLGQNVSHTAYDMGPMNGGVGQFLSGRGNGSFLALPPKASGLTIPGDATALVVTDLNTDDAPDIVVAQNNREVLAFVRTRSSSRWCSIRFHGSVRNSYAIGARIEISWNGKRRLTTELYAGYGYLSQSSNRVFFPRPSLGGVGQIKITWPDGEKSQETFTLTETAKIVRRGG